MSQSFSVRNRSGSRLLFICSFFLLLLLMITGFRMKADAKITFDQAEVNVIRGQTRKLKVKCGSKYKIRSSNKGIAKVTHGGNVTGIKNGTCRIIVTCGGETASIKVNVMSSISSSEMLFIGHRGYQDKYPENTISSFKGAIKYGADGVEFDLWKTESNDLLVFHDLSLERMCKYSKTIQELTAQSRFSYKAMAYGKKDVIPTLDEAVSYLSKKRKVAFIHLKNPHVMIGAAGDMIADCIRRYGMTSKAVVFCSNFDTIAYFSAHHPDIQTGYLYLEASEQGVPYYIQQTKASGASWFFHFYPASVSYGNIRYAQQLGMKTGLYKTRKQKTILDLLDYGADFAMLYHKLIKK